MGPNPVELRHAHLFGPGPKRILSLDGGGIRGIISLAFIERIEELLRGTSLSEYFDLVGGTSTGAIIAAGLALGHSASHLIDLYLHIARKGFHRNWSAYGTLAPKFDAETLHAAVREQFGDETLGSDKLRCGLGIVAKRIDTGSVWVFHNHPNGAFFSPSATGGFTPNRDLLLADLLRASTAAPSYFAPERLPVAPGMDGLFVDGGVSPHNNPALLLMMLGSMRGYGFRWPLGADKLMMVSLGTGSPRTRPMWGTYETMPPLLLAVESLRSMMQDSNWLVQTLLQWNSHSPTPWTIDSEIGDLRDDHFSGQPLLHYLRYDVPLNEEWFETHLGLQLPPGELEQLKQFDQPDLAPRLLEIGRKAAAEQIEARHFPECFNSPKSSV